MTATHDQQPPTDADRLAVQRDYLIGVLVNQALQARAAGRGLRAEDEVAADVRAKVAREIERATPEDFFVQLARGEA